MNAAYFVNRRQRGVTRSPFYDLARLRQEECVWQDDQRTGALPRQLDKSGLDLARRARLKGRDDSSAHTGHFMHGTSRTRHRPPRPGHSASLLIDWILAGEPGGVIPLEASPVWRPPVRPPDT